MSELIQGAPGTAWVTGAGKGLGRYIALELATRGWTVAATARTETDLCALARDTASLKGRVVAYPGDITDPWAMARLVDEIEDAHGPLGLAVLNAGTYIRFGAEDFTADAFARQITVNLIGAANGLAPVMAGMIKRRAGHIAVVSSSAAYRGLPLASAYGASKAGLTNMCEALWPELARHGVGLSVVHPGFVRTPLTEQNDFPMPFMVEPDWAARRIVDGLECKKFEIAFPWRFIFWLKLGRLLPCTLYLRLTRRLLKP